MRKPGVERKNQFEIPLIYNRINTSTKLVVFSHNSKLNTRKIPTEHSQVITAVFGLCVCFWREKLVGNYIVQRETIMVVQATRL